MAARFFRTRLGMKMNRCLVHSKAYIRVHLYVLTIVTRQVQLSCKCWIDGSLTSAHVLGLCVKERIWLPVIKGVEGIPSISSLFPSFFFLSFIFEVHAVVP